MAISQLHQQSEPTVDGKRDGLLRELALKGSLELLELSVSPSHEISRDHGCSLELCNVP